MFLMFGEIIADDNKHNLLPNLTEMSASEEGYDAMVSSALELGNILSSTVGSN